MSAENGGRNRPPTPPPGHEPPAPEDQRAIQITKEIVMQSQALSAGREEDGGFVGFVVMEGLQAVQYTFHFGEPGKKRILEELAGGIALP